MVFKSRLVKLISQLRVAVLAAHPNKAKGALMGALYRFHYRTSSESLLPPEAQSTGLVNGDARIPIYLVNPYITALVSCILHVQLSRPIVTL